MDKKSLIMFGDDDTIIDVCLFEDMPFTDEYTVINQWRAGDIMNVLIDEGNLKNEELNEFTKVMSVRVSRYYTMDIEALEDGDSKPTTRLLNEYTVGVSIMSTHIMAGRNIIVENMDQKIRDIKLKKILDSK